MIRSVILLLASTLLVSESQILLHYLILQKIVGCGPVSFPLYAPLTPCSCFLSITLAAIGQNLLIALRFTYERHDVVRFEFVIELRPYSA